MQSQKQPKSGVGKSKTWRGICPCLSLLTWSFYWWNPLGPDTINYFTVAPKLFSCFIDVPISFLLLSATIFWAGIFISHCENNTLIQFLDSLACSLLRTITEFYDIFNANFVLQINKGGGRTTVELWSSKRLGQSCAWLLICPWALDHQWYWTLIWILSCLFTSDTVEF